MEIFKLFISFAKYKIKSIFIIIIISKTHHHTNYNSFYNLFDNKNVIYYDLDDFMGLDKSKKLIKPILFPISIINKHVDEDL